MVNIIDTYIDNFGYAPVLVVDKKGKRAGAAAAGENSRRVEETFLQSVPAGAKTSLQADENEPPYEFFPLLGVYLGYVNRQGIKNLEENGQKVYSAAANIRPIRPVSVRAAESVGDETWGISYIRIPELWKQGLSGKNVAVGLCDTGIDARHEALRGRLKGWIDTDFSGRIIPDSRPTIDAAYDEDDNIHRGHGTHTSGTVCGGLDNGMAIGVAPGCDLYVCKCIERGNGMRRTLRGLEWCLEKEVRVINLSLGWPEYDPFLIEITNSIRQNEALLVCAIGNEGAGTFRIPGAYPPPIAVGAIDSNGRVAEFSSSTVFNRQEDPIQPNLVAPGNGVISAKPGGGLREMSGTSMAAPHVSGIAAILFESSPDATVEQVERALLETCKPLVNEEKERYGRGLVDPLAALDALKRMK
jgi:subtilisin family serine protease